MLFLPWFYTNECLDEIVPTLKAFLCMTNFIILSSAPKLISTRVRVRVSSFIFGYIVRLDFILYQCVLYLAHIDWENYLP